MKCSAKWYCGDAWITARALRLGDLSPVTPVSLCCDAGGPNPAENEKHDGVGSSSGPALRTTRT